MNKSLVSNGAVKQAQYALAWALMIGGILSLYLLYAGDGKVK